MMVRESSGASSPTRAGSSNDSCQKRTKACDAVAPKLKRQKSDASSTAPKPKTTKSVATSPARTQRPSSSSQTGSRKGQPSSSSATTGVKHREAPAKKPSKTLKQGYGKRGKKLSKYMREYKERLAIHGMHHDGGGGRIF